MDEVEELPDADRDAAMAYMSRHFVALLCECELTDDKGNKKRGIDVFSGFLLDLLGHRFWVTAGHCFKDNLDAKIEAGSVKVIGGSFLDHFGLEPQFVEGVPYTYELGDSFYIEDPDMGLDVAIIIDGPLLPRKLMTDGLTNLKRLGPIRHFVLSRGKWFEGRANVRDYPQAIYWRRKHRPQPNRCIQNAREYCLAQPRSTSPVCNLAARPRRAVSETTFDGTLIPETSFETLRSEDSLAKCGDAFGVEKPRYLRPGRQASVVVNSTVGTCSASPYRLCYNRAVAERCRQHRR